MDYIPENAYKIIKDYSKNKQSVPMILVKLYAYQMFRSLAYIHAIGVCHRDIKPQNLLIDPSTNVLKLCDFGSAKKLIKSEPNVAYICSRYYRAPELVFGATDYTTMVDVWSAGCVVAEFILGQPLFPGESAIDQLVEIIKVLGTPSRQQILSMNSVYKEYKFPHIKVHPWHKVFKADTPKEAIDFVSSVLVYEPTRRPRPVEALLHPFFDELRQADLKLPEGKALPALFNFTKGTSLIK